MQNDKNLYLTIRHYSLKIIIHMATSHFRDQYTLNKLPIEPPKLMEKKHLCFIKVNLPVKENIQNTIPFIPYISY